MDYCNTNKRPLDTIDKQNILLHLKLMVNELREETANDNV